MVNNAYALVYLIFLEIKRIIFGIKYFAEIDVTDNCNLRCKHCYHFGGKKDFRVKELSLDVWKERLNDIYKKGVRFILLVGGEPAIRKDILLLADSIFPFIHVITNGTMLISNSFNHPLFVSLEGGQKTNDSIRGDGVFSRVIRNYAGDKRVIINMTLNASNYKELEDVIKIAKENDFRGVVCNMYTPVIGGRNSLLIESADRERIINEMKRLKSIYPNHFLLTEPMIKWYESPNHVGYCHWGDEVLHLDVSWTTRRCFANADCSNCGCLAGALQNPLKLLRYPAVMRKLV